MKKTFVGIVLALVMTISLGVVAFADLTGLSGLSIPICFDVDIQE